MDCPMYCKRNANFQSTSLPYRCRNWEWLLISHERGRKLQSNSNPIYTSSKIRFVCNPYVLSDFPESLSLVTESRHAERVVMNIATAEFILHNSELTWLFMQLQQDNRNYP